MEIYLFAAAVRALVFFDETVARRIRAALRATSGVTERRMFGGLAFLSDGPMCCGIVGYDLKLRVGPVECDAVLRKRHVRPMDFTGRPPKGFVYVSPPAFRTEPSLRQWLRRAVRFVRHQPRSRKSDRRIRR